MKGVVVSPSSGWILGHIVDRMISAMPDVFHRVGQNGPVEDVVVSAAHVDNAVQLVPMGPE